MQFVTAAVNANANANADAVNAVMAAANAALSVPRELGDYFFLFKVHFVLLLLSVSSAQSDCQNIFFLFNVSE